MVNRKITNMNRKIPDWSDRTLNDGKHYQKIGKRYHAVSDLSALDGLSNGNWLVVVDAGSTSVRKCIEPDNATLESAFLVAEEKLAEIISKACEARPKSTSLTPRERRAIKAYNKIMGKEKMVMFQYQSICDMAREILTEVAKWK